MEYLVNKNSDVARNIFDLGMKKFVTEPAFVAEYTKFLMHLNEENS
jgi:cleavage stimulation factor subunit 3